MNSDKEFAAYFKEKSNDSGDARSATADLYERIWSQVQNFQEGSIAEITATTLSMINFVGRTHCLNINTTELVKLIHDTLQNTKSF